MNSASVLKAKEMEIWRGLDKMPDGVRLIIAGSRRIFDYDILESELCEPGFCIREIVSGGAQGVDRLGERWARAYGFGVKRFVPDWEKYGRSAGYLRNEKMAQYADALLAVWDGESKGTAHMINCMRELGKPLRVVEAKAEPKALFVPAYQMRECRAAPARRMYRH